MKYVFVLIWSLIPSNPFHGPLPYANTWGKKTERESGRVWLRLTQRKKHCSDDGSVFVLYIMRFNWIVLPQCQEVTWCVCRGLCSFWLREWLSFFSPKQANTWTETKSFSSFNSERETQTGRRYCTLRQMGNISISTGLVLKVPKSPNITGLIDLQGIFRNNQFSSEKGYEEEASA